MVPTAAEFEALARWTAALLGDAEAPPAFPFSFTYAKRSSAELLPGWMCVREAPQAGDNCVHHCV
ncbi:MAG: hypothetical protein WCP21_19275, partial [Armatimonadota bacterium]